MSPAGLEITRCLIAMRDRMQSHFQLATLYDLIEVVLEIFIPYCLIHCYGVWQCIYILPTFRLAVTSVSFSLWNEKNKDDVLRQGKWNLHGGAAWSVTACLTTWFPKDEEKKNTDHSTCIQECFLNAKAACHAGHEWAHVFVIADDVPEQEHWHIALVPPHYCCGKNSTGSSELVVYVCWWSGFGGWVEIIEGLGVRDASTSIVEVQILTCHVACGAGDFPELFLWEVCSYRLCLTTTNWEKTTLNAGVAVFFYFYFWSLGRHGFRQPWYLGFGGIFLSVQLFQVGQLV